MSILAELPCGVQVHYKIVITSPDSSGTLLRLTGARPVLFAGIMLGGGPVDPRRCRSPGITAVAASALGRIITTIMSIVRTRKRIISGASVRVAG